MRADAFQREPKLLKPGVYEWSKRNQAGAPKFVLHDGPPYANGSPHIGHVLNKVLKDITVRYKLLRGFDVDYVPGWDCHGLPIEVKALEAVKAADRFSLPPMDIRKKAREYALQQIEIQKEEFIRWGVIGDWDSPYRTMDKEYEAEQLAVFNRMAHKGYIYRDLKPVHWSPSSRTALAEAELEYSDDHVSPSLYVKFPISSLGAAAEGLKAFPNLSVVIWTTTPWTLPANRAVCVSQRYEYSVVEWNGEHLIFATERMAELRTKLKHDLPTRFTLNGSALVGSSCTHPFDPAVKSVVLDGNHVTIESGTGLVHTAPGHGHDDFHICKIHKIPAYCPVDEHGKYSSDVNIDELKGKSVLDEANPIVTDMLKTKNLILFQEKYKHRYPYDWRTKKPIIIRATRQWFCDLTEIKTKALQVVHDSTRDDWCISRQRHWGVPIPVFYDEETNEHLMNDETISHIQQLFVQHGSDCWWTLDTEQLLHPNYRNNCRKYKKGMDTMDVWFDSGVSWAGVLKARNQPLPADVYLEGSDQHRGWFQSSLLTSVAATEKAPYKTIVTHGFTVDEHFRKMSKSLGNVIAPSYIIAGGKDKTKAPAYGVDVMRMWVASTDYAGDVAISDSAVALVSTTLKKVRNTARFLLGNLYDFDASKDLLPYSQLEEVDRYMLFKLTEFVQDINDSYDSFAYHKAYQAIATFSSIELSSFYFSIIKDRLYSLAKSSPARRSAQTVLYNLLNALTKAIAPIAVHTAEDIFQHSPKGAWTRSEKNQIDSVFAEGWLNAPNEWKDTKLAQKWESMLTARNQVLYFVEQWRQEKEVHVDKPVGSALETDAWIFCEDFSVFRTVAPEKLAEFFIVSSVHVLPYNQRSQFASMSGLKGTVTLSEKGGYAVGVARTKNHKCPRCWKSVSPVEGQLCSPCDDVLASEQKK